jgi:hypothetical protein
MVHPLMASYGFVCVLLLACLSSRDIKVKTAAALGFFSAAILLAVYLCHLGMPQVGDYTQVARTRTYWFLDQWHWHERFGLAAPLAILTSIGLRRRGDRANVSMWLAQVGVVGGSTTLIVATLFARTSSSINLVARLQPLRKFEIVYLLMILAIGATLAEHVLKTYSLPLGGAFYFAWSHYVLCSAADVPLLRPSRVSVGQTREWMGAGIPVDQRQCAARRSLCVGR